MSWGNFLFGLRGRINRLQALTGIYGFGLILMLALVAGGAFIGRAAPGGGILFAGAFGAIFVVAVAIMITSQVAIFVRRAHDVGLSGWIVLLWLALSGLVIVANLILPGFKDSWLELALLVPTVVAAFWLLFTPGQSSANRFGEPPRSGWLP